MADFELAPITYSAGDPHTPRFGFYLRMRDGFDDEDWLVYYNPTATELRDLDDATAASRDPDRDPFETERDLAAAVTRPSFTSADLLDPSNTVVLFDLPIQDVVSMGSLQHLYFFDRPTYALGNSWGGAVNNLFDNYFISTIPQDPSWALAPLGPNQFPVPHTGMIPSFNEGNENAPGNALPAESLQSPESSRHLLLKGMFNINSTSVDAWRSILSSLNIENDPHVTADTNWQYLNGTIPLRNAFFRFSQTGEMLGSYSNNPAVLANPGNAYQQGVRELLDADIDFIAQWIVDELRIRGRPFQTLAAFINSGIIQDAIDQSGVNGGIPLYAPAFLTQGDVVTALAPFMLARSDTFLVRAYGDATNPATGAIEGRAWCEAIVQRLPTPYDPRAISNNFMNPDNSPYGQFGRKFEIIYFRWLDSSEL